LGSIVFELAHDIDDQAEIRKRLCQLFERHISGIGLCHREDFLGRS
jgi:hypothetical protein